MQHHSKAVVTSAGRSCDKRAYIPQVKAAVTARMLHQIRFPTEVISILFLLWMLFRNAG